MSPIFHEKIPNYRSFEILKIWCVFWCLCAEKSPNMGTHLLEKLPLNMGYGLQLPVAHHRQPKSD